MKTGRTYKIISISGLIAASVFTFTACSGSPDNVNETTLATDPTTTVASTTEPKTTVVATEPETTTSTQETETSKSGELTHSGSEVADNSFIFPDSDSRYLSRNDLKGFDVAKVRLARNEIFARHGFDFEDKTLKEYFSGKSWYKPTVPVSEWENVKLNDYEAANRDFFLAVEDELKGGSGNSAKDYSDADLKNLYADVLGNGKYAIYSFAHLDNDEIKELVVSEYVSSFGESYGNDVDIYTYKNDKISFVGHITGAFMPLQYSSSRKSILYARGGGGSIEDIFYSVDGKNLVREEYMSTTEIEPKYYHNYRSDDANTETDIYDYEIEISLNEYESGRKQLKEGMEDMVFKRL